MNLTQQKQAKTALHQRPDKTATDQMSQDVRSESARLLRLKLEQIAALPEYAERCACRHCGGTILPYWLDGPGGRKTLVFREAHGCQAEQAATAEQRQQAEIEAGIQAESDRANRIERAGLVGWLATATFESFNHRPDWQEAVAACLRAETYTDLLLKGELTEKNWLVLHGNLGTGKTHLSAAIAHRALEAGWQRVYFRVWTDYLNRIQASYKPTDNPDLETEADIISELQAGDLVVIDDLDKRKSDFTRRTLFSVLNHRYNARLPTILTFNYSPQDIDPLAPGRLALEDYLGRAVLDRVIERVYDVIEFAGPSFRSGESWK